MKWDYNFTLKEKGESFRIYKCDNINARLDFFDHILRVAIFKDNERLFPTYSICPGECKINKEGRDRLSTTGLNPLTEEDDLKIDNVNINIDLHNFLLSYSIDGNRLFSDRNIMAYNLNGEMGKGSYHYISREKDEQIFGLGDKTGNVNKNGRRFKIETFDAMGFDANSSDPLYKQIPFYICKNPVGSYGIFYDTYSNGEIDFGREINNYYEGYKYAKFEEDSLIYYVIFGTVEEIVRRFIFLTGKAILPPKWSYRYCGSTMTYTDAPNADEQLYGFLSLIKKYDIDCGGFYLSSGYTQIGENRYVFNWNKDKIKDPIKLSKDFKEMGINFIANIKPAFLTDHPLYNFIASKGWFLHYLDGSPALFPFWGGKASYFDFTNSDAFDFWTECVEKNLVNLGYDSIWNDNNEYDIHDDDVYANGFGHQIKAKFIRPLFSLLMSMASKEALKENKRIMNVSRSAIAGTERIASTWTGDNRTSFGDFRGNHKMAMTMALSGYRLFGQDIGGFAGPKPSKELFIRWIQYGLFTPRFVLHSWKEDGSVNMPWLYEDLIPLVSKLFDFRKKLIPYIYSEANRAIEEYDFMLTPLFIKYPEYDVESDFYLFGSSILSCPVFDEGTTKIDINLPKTKDGWYYKDKLYNGKISAISPLNDLPVFFIKAGSIIPMDEDGIKYHIYPYINGEYSYKFYDDETTKNRYKEIKVQCNEDNITIKGIDSINSIIIHDEKNRRIILE